MRDILVEAYLDYVNNYLMLATWAEHEGLTEEQASALIMLARSVYHSKHPDA